MTGISDLRAGNTKTWKIGDFPGGLAAGDGRDRWTVLDRAIRTGESIEFPPSETYYAFDGPLVTTASNQVLRGYGWGEVEPDETVASMGTCFRPLHMQNEGSGHAVHFDGTAAEINRSGMVGIAFTYPRPGPYPNAGEGGFLMIENCETMIFDRLYFRNGWNDLVIKGLRRTLFGDMQFRQNRPQDEPARRLISLLDGGLSGNTNVTFTHIQGEASGEPWAEDGLYCETADLLRIMGGHFNNTGTPLHFKAIGGDHLSTIFIRDFYADKNWRCAMHLEGSPAVGKQFQNLTWNGGVARAGQANDWLIKLNPGAAFQDIGLSRIGFRSTERGAIWADNPNIQGLDITGNVFKDINLGVGANQADIKCGAASFVIGANRHMSSSSRYATWLTATAGAGALGVLLPTLYAETGYEATLQDDR